MKKDNLNNGLNLPLSDLEEKKVYHRISDAMEDEAAKSLEDNQNKIILDNARGGEGGQGNPARVSKRGLFRIHKSLSFVNREYAIGGLISTFLSITSLILLVLCIFDSVYTRGIINNDIIFRSLYSFIVSLFSFFIGFRSFKEEDKKYLFSKIGLYTALAILLFWIIIYIRGLLIGR